MKVKKYQIPSGNLTQMWNSLQNYQDKQKNLERDDKFNKALQQSYKFYNTDVVNRRNRERSFFNTYTINNPIENTPIGIGESQTSFTEDPNLQNQRLDSAGSYNLQGNGIYIDPQHIINNNRDVISNTITHELAHEDMFQLRDYNFEDWMTFKPLFKPNLNITNKEVAYLSNAYKTNEQSETEASDKLWEKHATNRELRQQLWQSFIQEYGREPELEEFDKYIKDYDSGILRSKLRSTNDYGYDYSKSINSDEDINNVKESLIHVAFNNNQKNNSDLQYAKTGGIINYLNLFK